MHEMLHDIDQLCNMLYTIIYETILLIQLLHTCTLQLDHYFHKTINVHDALSILELKFDLKLRKDI